MLVACSMAPLVSRMRKCASGRSRRQRPVACVLLLESMVSKPCASRAGANKRVVSMNRKFRRSRQARSRCLPQARLARRAAEKVTFGTNWLAAGRAWRLLPGGRRRHLCRLRPRRDHPAGRPAGQRPAAAAGRQDRLLHGRQPASRPSTPCSRTFRCAWSPPTSRRSRRCSCRIPARASTSGRTCRRPSSTSSATRARRASSSGW